MFTKAKCLENVKRGMEFSMKCEECKDEYPVEDMPWGLGPDCWDNFDRQTLEEKLEDIGII